MTPWYKEYSDFLAEYFDGKIQKLSVDAAFSCPNRDGTIGRGGCAYCNNLSFSPMSDKREHSVARQIELGKEFFARKYPQMKYLAYFQSYTSSHGELPHLLSLYREAAAQPDVVGLVIGTRPDCMPDVLLDELTKIGTRIFIEFGAESSHDSTLAAINRGHTWARVCDAVQRTVKAGFPLGCTSFSATRRNRGDDARNRSSCIGTADFHHKIPPVANLARHATGSQILERRTDRSALLHSRKLRGLVRTDSAGASRRHSHRPLHRLGTRRPSDCPALGT